MGSKSNTKKSNGITIQTSHSTAFDGNGGGVIAVDTGGGSPSTLTINLVNLDPAVLATLNVGDDVILHVGNSPIKVTALSGVGTVGLVAAGDEARVLDRGGSSGVIVSKSDQPPYSCTVRVL